MAIATARQNWFEHSAAEHRAVREGVALFDQSSFAKFRFEGRDTVAVLNRICANNIDVTPGRVVYTQWLNERGGIEADLTVTRLTEHAFMIVSAAETEVRDFYWLKRHIPDDAHCVLTNVTSGMGVISIMGPKARDLLQSLTYDDMSHKGFPFATSREIELGYGYVRASRITFVGELGWELYIPTEFMQDTYDRIVAAGAEWGLAHAGYHALNSLRTEKAYRHWSHDITDEDSPLEAGLDFVVKWDKPGGFVGREALLEQREQGLSRHLVQLRLKDPEPLIYHNEPIWRDGALVGHITSGAYGHTLGGAVGLGYVSATPGDAAEAVLEGTYEVEVACEKIAAEVSLRPLYDPENSKIRS
jgi:4-methylaminobutanoate oxidase (formaldehyde-forming)